MLLEALEWLPCVVVVGERLGMGVAVRVRDQRDNYVEDLLSNKRAGSGVRRSRECRSEKARDGASEEATGYCERVRGCDGGLMSRRLLDCIREGAVVSYHCYCPVLGSLWRLRRISGRDGYVPLRTVP